MANFRRNPFTATFQPVERVEIFQIPASKIIQLTEIPLYSSNSALRPQIKYLNTGALMTEVFTPTPGADQYCVDYIRDNNVPAITEREGTGRVSVNVAVGEWVLVKYQGIGRVDFRQPISDDGIGYAYGLTENTPETILDYRGFTLSGWFPISTYISGDRYYSIMSTGSSVGLRLYTAPINQNTPTATLPSNGTITTANWFKTDSRVHSFLASDGRIGVIWTNSANAYQGKISTNPLNAADMGGWSDIAFPVNFNQYACSTQIGNQVFFFGCNGVLNTASNTAVRYNADTQSGVLLANLPNNWQYGACEYDGNGGIWLIGNMLTGQVGQVLKYSIWDNTYETKTAITFPLSFGAGTNTALYFGAIPNGGVLLNQEQNGFLIERSHIYRKSSPAGFYEKLGFAETPMIFYDIQSGDQKQIQSTPDREVRGYVGSDTTIAGIIPGEESRASNSPYVASSDIRLFSQVFQINRFQNGMFFSGPTALAGQTAIIRNTIRG